MELLGLESTKIEQALRVSKQFKRLHKKHHEIEEKITRMDKSLKLSAAEELEIKKLKKIKLTGKDIMTRILCDMEAGNS